MWEIKGVWLQLKRWEELFCSTNENGAPNFVGLIQLILDINVHLIISTAIIANIYSIELPQIFPSKAVEW